MKKLCHDNTNAVSVEEIFPLGKAQLMLKLMEAFLDFVLKSVKPVKSLLNVSQEDLNGQNAMSVGLFN